MVMVVVVPCEPPLYLHWLTILLAPSPSRMPTALNPPSPAARTTRLIVLRAGFWHRAWKPCLRPRDEKRKQRALALDLVHASTRAYARVGLLICKSVL